MTTQRPASEAIPFSPSFSFEAFESPSPLLVPQTAMSYADPSPSTPHVRIVPLPSSSSVVAPPSPAPILGLKGKKSRFSMIVTKSGSPFSTNSDSPLSRKRSSKLSSSFSPSPGGPLSLDEQHPPSPSGSLFARKLKFRSGLGGSSSSASPRSPSLHRATLDPTYLTEELGVAGSASSVTLMEGEEGWVGVQKTASAATGPPSVSSPSATEGRGKGKGGQGWYAGKRKNDQGEIVAIGPDGVEYVVMKLAVKPSVSPSGASAQTPSTPSDSSSIVSRASSLPRDETSFPSPASIACSDRSNRSSSMPPPNVGTRHQLPHRASHSSSISSISSTSSLGQELIEDNHPTPVPSQPSAFASPASQSRDLPLPSSRSSSISSTAKHPDLVASKAVRSESRPPSLLASGSSVMLSDVEKDSPEMPSELLPSAPSPSQQPDQPRPFQNWESHSPSSSLSSIVIHPSSSSGSSASSAIFDSTSNNSMDTTSSSLTSITVSTSSHSLASQSSKSSKTRKSSTATRASLTITSATNAAITKTAIATLQKELQTQQARHVTEKDALIFALSESKNALSTVRSENSHLLQEVRSLHILLEEVRKALEEDASAREGVSGLPPRGRGGMASSRSLRTLASRQSLISLASFVGGTRLGGDMEREIRGLEESLSAKFGIGRRWLTEKEHEEEDMCADNESRLGLSDREDEDDDGETTADEGEHYRRGRSEEEGEETEDEDSSLQLVRAELVRTLPLPPSCSPVPPSFSSVTSSPLEEKRRAYSLGGEGGDGEHHPTPIRPKRSSARLDACRKRQHGLGLTY